MGLLQKKKKHHKKDGGVDTLGVTSNATACASGMDGAQHPAQGCFTAASPRALPRKPHPWGKRLLHRSLKPRVPEEPASFRPAGGEGRHEGEGRGDRTHAAHAVKLGLA